LYPTKQIKMGLSEINIKKNKECDRGKLSDVEKIIYIKLDKCFEELSEILGCYMCTLIIRGIKNGSLMRDCKKLEKTIKEFKHIENIKFLEL